jgi:hypothetical protein
MASPIRNGETSLARFLVAFEREVTSDTSTSTESDNIVMRPRSIGTLLAPAVLVTGMFATTAQAQAAETTFEVTVENVSTPGLLDTDRAMGVVPLSPGVFVTFEGDDPAFTVGEIADSGTTLIGEDGFPGPMPFITEPTELEILTADDAALQVGTFAAPGGTPDVPGIFPGETATFSFTATSGQRLQIETMFVQSNDWFFAFGNGGLALFDGDTPISGDVTSELVIYDAGTEVDTQPGTGPTAPLGGVQKPVQDPMATDVGDAENEPIQDARERFADFDIPDNNQIIRVTISPTTDTTTTTTTPTATTTAPAPADLPETGSNTNIALVAIAFIGLGAIAMRTSRRTI